MNIKRAFETGYIPEKLRGMIPSNCKNCGSELDINVPSLSQLRCVNDECTIFLPQRIHRMLKMLGVKGLGEELCIDIVNKHSLKKPYDIFEVLGENLTSRYGNMKNLELSVDIKNSLKGTLAFAVRSMKIPDMDTSCEKIFASFNSLDEFYNYISDDAFNKIADYLNIRSDTQTVEDIVYKLVHLEEEIRKHVSYFEIKKVAKEHITICITGSVNGYKSKETFVSNLNSIYGERVNVVFLSSLTSDTSVLISETESSSSKYKKASKSGSGIKIMTSKQFIEYLDENYS